MEINEYTEMISVKTNEKYKRKRGGGVGGGERFIILQSQKLLNYEVLFSDFGK